MSIVTERELAWLKAARKKYGTETIEDKYDEAKQRISDLEAALREIKEYHRMLVAAGIATTHSHDCAAIAERGLKGEK